MTLSELDDKRCLAQSLAVRLKEAERRGKEHAVLNNRLEERTKQLDKTYTRLAKSFPGRVVLLSLRAWDKAMKPLSGVKHGFARFVRDRLKPIARYVFKHTPILSGWYKRRIDRLNAQARQRRAQQRQLPDYAYVPQEEFEAGTDRGFLDAVKPLLNDIPQSNGQRYYEPSRFRVALIADEFFRDSIVTAADFQYLSPESWERTLPGCDMLLFVSTWSGERDEWRLVATPNSSTHPIAHQIIRYCHRNGIPVVFYCKEDPPNYEHFQPLARCCDAILTSCEEVVERYRADCQTNQVGTLRFCVNPQIHNPVGSRGANRRAGVLFAGSWMVKYPHRLELLRMLLGGVIASGEPLKIIDRNYCHKHPDYRFDEVFWPYISPSVNHKTLQLLHKLYGWAININSVQFSKTMFANRGYELQALGVSMISNYSLGMNRCLPGIAISGSSDEVARILTRTPPDELYEQQMMGVRAVMTGETCYDRIGTILSMAGLPYSPTVRSVAVVADRDTAHIRAMFDSQTLGEKTLLFEDAVTPEALAAYDIVAFFSDDMEYELFYLEDMVNAFKYTDSDYITKDAYASGDTLHEGKEHDYVTVMGSKYRSVFWRASFPERALLDMRGSMTLPRGYAIDRLHYNSEAQTRLPPRVQEPLISVIVPVMNDGYTLYSKAFASLLRSSLFERTQVILVDDGSTDGKTVHLLRWLEKRYANVECFFLGKGWSGGVARARGKGLEMARAAYVACLNPGDESVGDGLQKCYEEIIRTGCEFAVGSARCLGRDEVLENYAERFFTEGRPDAANLKAFLADKLQFAPIRVGAMLIDRDVALRSHITQPVQITEAGEEDALFCWRLFMNARDVRAIPDVVHVHYLTDDEMENPPADPDAFQRLLLIAQRRRDTLAQYDLMARYLSNRFSHSFREEVLNRLRHAKRKDGETAARVAFDIGRLYGESYSGQDPVVASFWALCEAGDFQGAYNSLLTAED